KSSLESLLSKSKSSLRSSLIMSSRVASHQIWDSSPSQVSSQVTRVHTSVYIYIINIHSTHTDIYYVNKKLLFWIFHSKEFISTPCRPGPRRGARSTSSSSRCVGLKNLLAKENPVLSRSSLDVDPQVSHYWLRGERTVAEGHRRGRIDQIRIPQQLPEFVPLEAEISADVPVITLAPDLLPLFRRQFDNNIFMGANLEDPCCYGHTQFHMVPDRFRRDKMSKRGLSDQVEVSLRANGIASLFAWTGAQAMYQGFWSEEDVSRPFVSQALNTLALSPRADGNNSRKNFCWGTESMRLCEGITDGDIVGLNDAVLKLLLQFLLNKPQF
uniref:Uncharacterized protein n=1 Tax=Sinocyclocheilus anshuiensis TaxID=1608454 RepID=A0A671RXN9_9TELE